MTQTIGVWNSGFRLIIWLPLNNNKWFDRHSIAKKKERERERKKKENKSKKQTNKKNQKTKTNPTTVQICVFPWGIKVHRQVLYVQILH